MYVDLVYSFFFYSVFLISKHFFCSTFRTGEFVIDRSERVFIEVTHRVITLLVKKKSASRQRVLTDIEDKNKNLLDIRKKFFLML